MFFLYKIIGTPEKCCEAVGNLLLHLKIGKKTYLDVKASDVLMFVVLMMNEPGYQKNVRSCRAF